MLMSPDDELGNELVREAVEIVAVEFGLRSVLQVIFYFASARSHPFSFQGHLDVP